MFEKLEKEPDPEAIGRVGAETLSKEIDILPDSKKAGGFLLTTFLAMGLAMAGAGSAEAQVRANRFSMGGPTSGITGEIFQQGRIGVSQAMERKKMEAGIKIDREFQKKLQEIEASKNQLEQEFRNERISIREFEIRKQQLDNEVYRLSREKDLKMMRPLGVKGMVLEGIIRGY